MPSAKRPPRVPRPPGAAGPLRGKLSMRDTPSSTTRRRQPRLLFGEGGRRSAGRLKQTIVCVALTLICVFTVLLSYRGMLLQLERREGIPLEVELQGGDGIRLQASRKDSSTPSIDVEFQREPSGTQVELDPVTGADQASKQEIEAPAAGEQSDDVGQGSRLAAGGVLSNPAVIVFTYNRPHYLKQTLKSLTNIAGLKGFSVYVSQDGTDVQVAATARTFGGERGDLAPPVTRGYELWQHPRGAVPPRSAGHVYVAYHYKWALDRVFNEYNHSHAILVEDDMLFSIDFLRYFEATAPLLEVDPTIWCISSWNDNGLNHFTWDTRRMFRTSYFPGLGWMLRRELWDELGPVFPLEQWDHWMRLDTTARGRECVVPEVNRNFNIGEKGANMESATYNKYLSKMVVSHELISDYGDLSYLVKGAYEDWIRTVVASARHWDRPASTPERMLKEMGDGHAGQVILVTYRAETYKQLSDVFGTWPYPRAHHRHAAYLRYKGVLFILADARFCPYLPDALQVKPSPMLKAVAAPRHTDCNSACGSQGMRCEEQDFWFINTCKTLAEHFPCERGCALVLGPDVPNYVESASLNTHQQCLVNQQQTRCAAKHEATARLCACVPR